MENLDESSERRSLYVHRYPETTTDEPLPPAPRCLAAIMLGTEERVLVPPEHELAVCVWLAIPEVERSGVFGWYS